MVSRVSNPIREARRRLKLTREQLGEILGCSGRFVSYFETGARQVPAECGPKLQAALGLTDGEVWQAMHFRRKSPLAIQSKRRPLW